MKREAKRPKPLRVRVEFVGAAAEAIRTLHARGLHGPTMQLVVEGLALAELRRELGAGVIARKCVRCNDDGNPCCMCGAAGQTIVPCDPKTGEELPRRPEEFRS